MEIEMFRRISVVIVLIAGLAGLASSRETYTPAGDAELRSASARAINAIQKSQAVWYDKQLCSSCHHQLLPEISFKMARVRSVPIDAAIASKHSRTAFQYMDNLDSIVQGDAFIDVFYNAISLVAADAVGIKPNVALAAEAQFVADRQLPDGNWMTFDERPPQSASLFTVTATSARAISRYLPQPEERAMRLNRARAWLLNAKPKDTEDKAHQLLGLKWTGAPTGVLQRLARELSAEQREDGGWSQLPNLASDAFATGEVLSALCEGGGIPTTNVAYQRGLHFLLTSQLADGTWHVSSRLHPPAPVSPPYFESGFPHKKDQFSSIMGTNWALIALLNAIPASEKESPGPMIVTAEVPEWARVTVTGSAIDLKRLLDKGMDPNSKTAAGTSALMMAVRDPEKVKLLIDRGANVSARAQSGIDALIVAARHRGSSATVRLLLDKGAKPNAEKGVDVLNQANALFLATTAGDTVVMRMLLDAGARRDEQMKVLGTFFASPMNYAVINNDLDATKLLIERGADVNEIGIEDGVSLLGWAAIGNRAGMVDLLIAKGAKVNYVDKLGMTPLLYAASIDWGDTAVIQKLIAAGADAQMKTPEGRTALDLARTYLHPRIITALSGKVASR
jgi:ankyrin repeat protein